MQLNSLFTVQSHCVAVSDDIVNVFICCFQSDRSYAPNCAFNHLELSVDRQDRSQAPYCAFDHLALSVDCQACKNASPAIFRSLVGDPPTL